MCIYIIIDNPRNKIHATPITQYMSEIQTMTKVRGFWFPHIYTTGSHQHTAESSPGSL